MRNLNKEESEKYIEIVKKGNYDDMADFAYKLALKDLHDARDDDSCECDNCHRTRKFLSTNK